MCVPGNAKQTKYNAFLNEVRGDTSRRDGWSSAVRRCGGDTGDTGDASGAAGAGRCRRRVAARASPRGPGGGSGGAGAVSLTAIASPLSGASPRSAGPAAAPRCSPPQFTLNLPICQSRKNNILIFCAFFFFPFCFPLFFHFHRKDQRG